MRSDEPHVGFPERGIDLRNLGTHWLRLRLRRQYRESVWIDNLEYQRCALIDASEEGLVLFKNIGDLEKPPRRLGGGRR